MTNHFRPGKLAVFLLGLPTLLLCSCSLHYAGDKNLNENRFSDYFAPSHVKMFENEQQLPKKHQLIGIVEGEDCQTKPHLAAPSPVNARTDARKKANRLGANAIIFNQCVTIPSQQCHSLLVCHGSAYQIPNEK